MSTEAAARKTAPTKKNKIKLFGKEYQTNEVVVGILFISNIRIKKPQNPGVILIVAVIALLLAHMFHLL